MNVQSNKIATVIWAEKGYTMFKKFFSWIKSTFKFEKGSKLYNFVVPTSHNYSYSDIKIRFGRISLASIFNGITIMVYNKVPKTVTNLMACFGTIITAWAVH